MFKRVFAPKRVPSVSKSIRIPEPMLEALEQLATEKGETLNSYVVLVLDQYLQLQVENGKLSLPEMSDEEKPAS